MKKNSKECFCALCRSPRKLRYSRFLSKMNYLQILFLAVGMTAILYPLIGFKGIASFPVVWAIFESVHKSLYRKELVCPYCGFDPKWYKKDVKLARQKVEEFLRDNPETPILRRVRKEEKSATQLN